MRRNPIEIKWTSKLAYAVGIITTDGNLSKDNRHVTLTSVDTQFIEVFKKCLDKNNRITLNPSSNISKKQGYRVQIGDVNLYDFLVKIGLFPNKSLTIGSLQIPDIYFRDFLRGHLDGDGSIIYYKDYYNTYLNPKYIYERLFVYFISASKKHVQWLRKEIQKLIHIKGNMSNQTWKRRKKSTMYRLKFSTKQAKIILNWIYYKPNLPCLVRKYLIAKPFLRN